MTQLPFTKLKRLEAQRLRAQLRRIKHALRCRIHADFLNGRRPQGDCKIIQLLEAKIASLTRRIEQDQQNTPQKKEQTT